MGELARPTESSCGRNSSELSLQPVSLVFFIGPLGLKIF